MVICATCTKYKNCIVSPGPDDLCLRWTDQPPRPTPPQDEQDKIIDKVIGLLEPSLRRSRRPEWSTSRYYTTFGSKTDQGLKASLKRIIFEEPPDKPLPG